MNIRLLLFTAMLFATTYASSQGNTLQETSGGWVKYKNSPVLGGRFGTIFDISVLKTPKGYLMYCSWRPKKSIALSRSTDGLHWSDPVIVLAPDSTTGWETELNRPVVIHHKGIYQMWYTGQSSEGDEGHSCIGYATSNDGVRWKRMSRKPVLTPQLPWEKTSLMCPHVLWDADEKNYKMWYSGGEQYEPDAIGYATSNDGVYWKKHSGNPVFKNDPENSWEQSKVTACQVIKDSGMYYMFYIGFRDIDYAQIGIARSINGISGWERNKNNPIIRPGTGWDSSAVYKPFAIYDGSKWLLWYNGRKDHVEQIGVAIHKGRDLEFGK